MAIQKRLLILIMIASVLGINCSKTGKSGSNGTNGSTSLIDLIPEPAGANCVNGGYKIVSGLDINNNRILDASEITVTKYICNGENAPKFLISIVQESPGTNCPTGGYRINSGLDKNNDAALNETEIMNSQFLCNGQPGLKSLVDLIPEPPGANCANGGYKVISGIDINNNNVLDVGEIQVTKYVCNGLNGSNSLVSFVQETPGVNCPNGGYKINSGLDLNMNGTLDVSEIKSSNYICNGVAGANSLVTLVTESAGSNCPNGGYKLNSGTDINGNGVLESAEIKNVSYICNGVNALNYLIAVKTLPAGSTCTYGGYSFNTGIDANKNGILDDAEITNVSYLCQNSSSDEIRIPVDFSANTTSTTGEQGLGINNFNKSNYPSMDSIIFAARVYSGNTSNNSLVDLINMTSNTPIANSLLSSNQPLGDFLYSGNLHSSFPNSAINVGLRVRSQNNGSFAGVYGTSYLILYRKK